MLCLISAVQQSDSVICILFPILFHYGLSQDIECSSLCYTGGPCCLLKSGLLLLSNKFIFRALTPPGTDCSVGSPL